MKIKFQEKIEFFQNNISCGVKTKKNLFWVVFFHCVIDLKSSYISFSTFVNLEKNKSKKKKPKWSGYTHLLPFLWLSTPMIFVSAMLYRVVMESQVNWIIVKFHFNFFFPHFYSFNMKCVETSRPNCEVMCDTFVIEMKNFVVLLFCSFILRNKNKERMKNKKKRKQQQHSLQWNGTFDLTHSCFIISHDVN